nr:MAG TPA: hypothetical protein [Caudoviricetes sp.]
METKVNLIENRLFLKLDDYWYLANRHSRTKRVCIYGTGFVIVQRDDVRLQYDELHQQELSEFVLTIFDSDTFPLMINNRVTYDDIKKESVKNISDDAEGMFILNWLNHKSVDEIAKYEGGNK